MPARGPFTNGPYCARRQAAEWAAS